MKCSKCNYDINDKMLVCPNCKKVLKLLCPKCDTVNKTNTCKKCGFVIVTKCHKCGKINKTINETCSKCGFSTYTSVAINSSNIDEFACLTIEFPNLADMESALGSIRLTEKFKANLDKLISSYTHSKGISREIIENVYIARFNKDASFSTSAQNAMQAAIEIQNLITELNFKLKKAANISLKCKMAVLKRDIYSQPSQYKSGFDIKLIYQHKQNLNLLNDLQIITDSYIYEHLCDKYDLSAITANFIKNEMITFFELNLKKYINIPKEKEKSENIEKAGELNFLKNDFAVEEEEDDSLYDIDSINFEELKCSFDKKNSLELIPAILKRFGTSSKKIISIKSKKEFFSQTHDLLTNLENSNRFKNVFRVTCYDEMKYKPYGFFYELISCIYNFSISPKNFANNNFDILKNLDSSGYIKDLINLTERTFPHPEDIRYSLFDIFFNIFSLMSNSLIYIENFEKIDDTSYEVLQLFFENFKNLDVSYLILADEKFSLHKNAHFLLTNRNYIEITMKHTPFKDIIKKDFSKYEKILNSHYLQKISQNTKGSLLYFNQIISYLLEKGLLKSERNTFTMEGFENVLIPPSLNELIIKRLKHLSADEKIFNCLGMFLLLGPRIDLFTLKLLSIENNSKILQKLIEKKYIYIYNNNVYIQNYNLYYENFLALTPLETKQKIAQVLLDKVFSSQIKHPGEVILYKFLEKEKQEFIVLEQLSRLNASLGDFSAYLNCSVKFLKMLDNHVSENSQKSIEEYKMEVYENISNLLYKYTPNKIHNITQVILNNLEQTTDDKKVINLCNKMLQGCLISGNYSHALALIHKILSRFSNCSINPANINFKMPYFLFSLIKVEILFSIGDLKNCIELGQEILDVITPQNLEKLKPKHFSMKQFEDIILDSMSFVILSKIILLENDLEDFIMKVQNNIGKTLGVFELFIMLQKTSKGNLIRVPFNMPVKEDEKFFIIILNILRAFNENKNQPKNFAGNIYQAKIKAKMYKLTQIEFICDLLIGYSYFKLKKYQKASTIYYNVLEISTTNGLKMVTYLAWYLISMLKLEQQDYEVALCLINNAIVQLEKDYNSSALLFFLFRILLSKILIAQNEKKSAELCSENAKFIKEKYGLKFEIGVTS
jgi:predicted RNA-binding Zn-ribbon protein involved in translation (DUF1610 family)